MMKAITENRSTAMSGINIAVVCTFLILIYSCGQTETNKLIERQEPIGKWRAISFQGKGETFYYDSNRKYILEIELNKKLSVYGEDNILSGPYKEWNGDSLSLESWQMTDVCCNTDTANILFQFFSVSSKFVLKGNRLTLVSEKGKLEFGKRFGEFY